MRNRIIHKIKSKVKNIIKKKTSVINYYRFKCNIKSPPRKINLCGGSLIIEKYYNVDIGPWSDLILDLGKKPIPFKDNSAEIVLCISAINYFTRKKGAEIIKDVYRVLKSGGIARFAVQDLLEISKKYVNRDENFFFQKLPNGAERFKGVTMADKINSWFYGYKTIGGKTCKYFYDFETLALLFKEAGFSKIERKKYRESLIPEIDKIDNRPDQMFFLEAIK